MFKLDKEGKYIRRKIIKVLGKLGYFLLKFKRNGFEIDILLNCSYLIFLVYVNISR